MGWQLLSFLSKIAELWEREETHWIQLLCNLVVITRASTFHCGLLKTAALAENDGEGTLGWATGFSNWLCY